MCMPGMKDKECLNQFHDRSLHPTVDQQNSKSRAIDQLVRHLHQQDILDTHSVAEVIKGGSLGKGTALKEQGQSDIDLVVLLNGIDGMEEFKSKRERILLDMKSRLRGYQGLVIEGRTPYSLKCKFLGEEVDILPALKIERRQLSSVYKAIRDAPNPEDEGQNYSASLTKFQVEFVSPENETVKRAIRAIKHWKKEFDLDIPSYTVELITIHTARFEGQGSSTRKLYTAVLALLENAGHLKITFNDFYNLQDYRRSLQAPYVLDPANPFKNTLQGTNINKLMQAAHATLPMVVSNPYL